MLHLKVKMSKNYSEIFTIPLCSHSLKMCKIWKPFLLAGSLLRSLCFREMMSDFIVRWWYFRSKAIEPLSWQKASSIEAELSFLFYLAGTWGICSSEQLTCCWCWCFWCWCFASCWQAEKWLHSQLEIKFSWKSSVLRTHFHFPPNDQNVLQV